MSIMICEVNSVKFKDDGVNLCKPSSRLKHCRFLPGVSDG